MRYTYLLLHPSSNVFIEKILTELKKKSFLIKGVYRISEWDTVLDDIYKNTYAKSNTVQQNVFAHAYINKYLFGNIGILILLYKKIPYNELIFETLRIKKYLRKGMEKTRDGTITISIDLKQVNICEYSEKIENCENKIYEGRKRRANIFFSYLHCPDTEEQYIEDFKVLEKYLRKENKLGRKEIKMMIKYCSYH